MREPLLVLNWPAVAVATIAAFILGGLWYGPLFGKAWASQMGMPTDGAPCGRRKMYFLLALQFVGTALTAWVLAYGVELARPSIWGEGPDSDGAAWMYGLVIGLMAWLGLQVPLQLGKVAWEGRSWKLFGINAGHDFVKLQLMAQILAHWR